ncbi:MAG: sulfatase-like hydrolase/transferase [Bacteroidota bacterium]
MGSYAAMVKSMDGSIGTIVAALEELNLTDETIIVFTSDNGGLTTLPPRREAPTAGLPLRAGKGWLYEGGIRVPLIVKWPGGISTGQVSSLSVSGVDIFPTLGGLVGMKDREAQIDGIDLSAYLLENKEPLTRNLYWHFPHYHGSGSLPSAAIRSGDYKLIHWYETGRNELYDLSVDLSETTDLSEKNKGIRDSLYRSLVSWQEEVGAHLPKPNPAFEIQESKK